jgi:hypothetical protein
MSIPVSSNPWGECKTASLLEKADHHHNDDQEKGKFICFAQQSAPIGDDERNGQQLSTAEDDNDDDDDEIDDENDSHGNHRHTESAANHEAKASDVNLSTTIPMTNPLAALPFTMVKKHIVGGGSLARHVGEERIVLFLLVANSEKRPIGKIIFSSMPSSSSSSLSLSSPSSSSPLSLNSSPVSSPEKNKSQIQSDQLTSIQATIHVLEVKKEFRGMDLGGLLVSDALALLHARYFYYHSPTPCDGKYISSPCVDSFHISLVAEEDCRRHNKLVHFYESFGFRSKSKCKELYLHSNDGETYRKISMELTIHRPHVPSTIGSLSYNCHNTTFIPLNLSVLCCHGVPSTLPAATNKFIVAENGNGLVSICTTRGHGPPWGINVEFSRMSDHPPYDGIAVNQRRRFEDNSSMVVNTAAVWILRCALSGNYLASNQLFNESDTSSTRWFWMVDPKHWSLIPTTDTPSHRHHYYMFWKTQTVAYVNSMIQRYQSFALQDLTLRDAIINVAANLPGYFCCANGGVSVQGRESTMLSLRTRCFHTAEICRSMGHPDWMQLVALLYYLGGIVSLLDPEWRTTASDTFNWTIPCRSRIVGCQVSAMMIYPEFHDLNADVHVKLYSTPWGMYRQPNGGLSQTLLSWSGPEYMFRMLQHNEHVCIPDEGLMMLRFAALSDWHRKGCYSALLNEMDVDVQDWVRDFDDILNQAQNISRESIVNMETRTIEELWSSHYGMIAAKYGMNRILHW